jgi:hypothetical protein
MLLLVLSVRVVAACGLPPAPVQGRGQEHGGQETVLASPKTVSTGLSPHLPRSIEMTISTMMTAATT